MTPGHHAVGVQGGAGRDLALTCLLREEGRPRRRSKHRMRPMPTGVPYSACNIQLRRCRSEILRETT